MTTVVGVRYKKVGKMVYFLPGALSPKRGDKVVIETQGGLEIGTCVTGKVEVEDEVIVPPLNTILRLATEEDKAITERKKEIERNALSVSRERALAHKLEMRIFASENTEGKIVFYYTADGRIDFRTLVRELSGILHSRIEMRQVGVRDEAKYLGGFGVCGRQFCCSTFLDDFDSVSIKSAKNQNLSLNADKISGNCGRLMCCLKYEEEAYKHIRKTMPSYEDAVETPAGRGVITDLGFLNRTIKVRLDDAPDAMPKTYSLAECKVVKNGKFFSYATEKTEEITPNKPKKKGE